MKDYNGYVFHPTYIYELLNWLISASTANILPSRFTFDVKANLDTPQIIFRIDGKYVGDAVCHADSYGHQSGLIELMGLGITAEKDGDGVKGWMTAEDVILQLRKYLKEEGLL